MAGDVLKWLLPNRPIPTRIWRGPFRGASIVMNPRHSMRKIFGLYEHELNAWLEQALRKVTRVLDIGLDFSRVDVRQAHFAEALADKELRSRDMIGSQGCVRGSRQYRREITLFVADIMSIAVASTNPPYIPDIVA